MRVFPLFLSRFGAALWLAAGLSFAADDEARIRIHEAHPHFWEYRGKPVLLLGGSDDDNLFQWDGETLVKQLDALCAAGGNCIRNTMGSRDDGNVHPHARRADGRYDLEKWNPEYWNRFERLLRMTAERGIIVQIELWDPWDIYGGQWQKSPWNPANNVNYDTETTRLATRYDPPEYRDGKPHGNRHDFFLTPPALQNDTVLLRHQRRFVEAVLARTLPHAHVLYCVTNEIHPHYPPEWGWYWAGFIRERAQAAGNAVCITEMFWTPDFRDAQHRASLDRPELYDFFEASQNSAVAGPEAHWNNLQSVRRKLATRPRPINHTKTYGADGAEPWAGTTRDGVERFWRSLIGGAASCRFHRPPYGLGLGPVARRHLKSARMLSEEFDFFRATPDSAHRLLGHGWFSSQRGRNEAYLTAVAGEQYAVYFPDGGKVELDLRESPGRFALRWLDAEACRWIEDGMVDGGKPVALIAPGAGHKVALLERREN